jgi:UTP--glucose-1-phosphate uridylyltransferase
VSGATALASSFAPFERKMRAEGLPDVAIRTFRYYYAQLLEGDPGTLSRAEIDPVEDVPGLGDLGDVRAAGEAALAGTVVIKLNGGLGTSMGMTRAKSLLPVRDELTFLDLIALQVRELRRRSGCAIPLVLMNSFRTRDDSLAALARHGGLSADLPPDFLQHKVPRILASDLSPVSWPAEPAYEWCPPGHGDIYTALVTSGMLEQLRAKGFRTAFVSNADNLGASLDLDVLGWFVSQGAPFAMEVKERTEADRKGGHLARLRDGRLTLREIAQCPEEERESFEDVKLYGFFNTNNLWIDLDALARALEERDGVLGLPMIRNEKTVDPEDPRSPRVIQLETAMGAAISVFEGARALRVPAHRFAPVKTTNDLLAVRSDAYDLAPDYRLVPAEGGQADALVVDLDPAFFKRVPDLEARFPHGPPSLRRCRRLRVRGDVRFGRDVVVVGEVTVEAPEGGSTAVPDGATLSG